MFAQWLLCMEFNAQQLLFQMFPYTICIFGNVEPILTSSVPITYSPRPLLRHSPRHSWHSHSKWFFEHESKGTNGDLHYVYEQVNVRTQLFIRTETEAYECSCKWRGEAQARMCKCSIRFWDNFKNIDIISIILI